MYLKEVYIYIYTHYTSIRSTNIYSSSPATCPTQVTHTHTHLKLAKIFHSVGTGASFACSALVVPELLKPSERRKIFFQLTRIKTILTSCSLESKPSSHLNLNGLCPLLLLVLQVRDLGFRAAHEAEGVHAPRAAGKLRGLLADCARSFPVQIKTRIEIDVHIYIHAHIYIYKYCAYTYLYTYYTYITIIYIYTYIYMYIHLYPHACIYIEICVYIHIYSCIHIYTCTYVYMSAYACMYACMHVYVYIYIYRRTRVYIHIYVRM